MATILFDEDYERETDQYDYKKRLLPNPLSAGVGVKGFSPNDDPLMSASFEDFLRWSQMEVKDIPLKRWVDENGVHHKKYDNSIPPNTYEVYLPNDWYCIDIDVFTRYAPDFVSRLPFTISSTGKRHYYCRINSDVNKLLGTNKPVDVLNFEITAEEIEYNKKYNSKFGDRKHGYGDILKKMWEAKDAILYFPRGMDNFQNIYFKMAFSRLLPYIDIPQTTLKEEANKFDDKSSNAEDEDKSSCYAKLLKILGRDWYEPYDNWSKVMWCLPQTEECRVEFLKWSERCPSKYDENSINSKWESCRNRNEYGFQTLLKYCRIENPEDTEKLTSEFKRNKQSSEHKLIYEFNATNIAKYFKQSNPFGYKFYRVWYELNPQGVWVEADGETPYQLRREMYDYVIKKLTEFSVATAQDTSLDEDVRKEILSKTCDAKKKLGDTTLKDKVIKELKGEYLDRELLKKLNANRLLWAFNNCVVDLSSGVKRKIQPSDYISITCGYDYPETTEDDKKKAMAHLQTMFKTPDELLFCLRCMASCLRGENLYDKWFIFKGKGGNGKGCFFDAMMKVFGNYWGVMPVEYFYTTTRKDPTRADLVAIHALFKRVLYSSEAQETDEDDKNAPKLNVAEIKKWSGKEQIKCRDNFAKSKEVIEYVPYGTLIWNTNGVPSIPVEQKQGSDALHRRLTIHEFPFTFVATQEQINDNNKETHKLGDPHVKINLQSDNMRNAIINILLETYDKEIRGKSAITILEETANTTKQFLSQEDDFVSDFMASNYEADETNNIKRDFVYLSYKDSNQYQECKLKATAFYGIAEKLGYKIVHDSGSKTRVFKNLKPKPFQESIQTNPEDGKPPM